MKKKVCTILCLVITLAVLVAVPVLAWFTETDGFKIVVTDYPDISAREDSTFSLTYGSSILDSSNSRLLAVAPSSNIYDGDSQVASDYFIANGLWAENDWYLSNTGATTVIDELDNLVLETGSAKHIVKLEGTLVSVGDSADNNDNNKGDNLIDIDDYFSYDYSSNIGNFDEANARPSGETNSTVADNKLILFNGFGSSLNKMVGVSVNITPKNAENSYDNAMVSSLRYALFYHKVTHVGGQEISDSRTVFYNNDFTYFDGTTKKRAVSQSHCFQYQKNTEVKITALIWLDGFADPRAESGAVDLKFILHDYANIISNDISLSHGDEMNTFTVNDCGSYNRADVVIPETIYLSDGSTVARITKIADEAFMGNTSIISVIIPDSVEEIGASAFSGCVNLEKATIGSLVTKIGAMAFYNTGLEVCYFANANGWFSGEIALGLNNLSNAQIASLLVSSNAETGGNSSSSEAVWLKT